MPPVIPVLATIASIVGPLAAAAGTGAQIYGMTQGPGAAPTPAGPAPPTPPPTGPTPEQQRALLAPQFPDIQALTGGSLSPEYYAQVAPVRAGISGAPGIE